MNRPERVALVILLIIGLPFLFVRLDLPLLDPDEGLYASIAQEILSRHDWVVPHVNGLPYLEKSPLYFWLTALTFRLVGQTEWAVRLWSTFATLGAVLFTWRIGRRLYGERAGLLAGLVLATIFGKARYVRKASTDQLFVSAARPHQAVGCARGSDETDLRSALNVSVVGTTVRISCADPPSARRVTTSNPNRPAPRVAIARRPVA